MSGVGTSDLQTDNIAREAARLMQSGKIERIEAAIHSAASSLGANDVRLPGHGLVRSHIQGMAMQTLGKEGYEQSIQNIWETAEQLMTLLEQALPDAQTLLVGRAAKGQVDGGVTVHVRLYTKSQITDIAQMLTEFEYSEPTFDTVDTTVGKLNRISFDDDGIAVVITRCLPEMYKNAKQDLFKDQPIETLTLNELRGKFD